MSTFYDSYIGTSEEERKELIREIEGAMDIARSELGV